MPRLSAAAVLKADDLPREVVPVPEWGGDILLRALSGNELDAWRAEWRVKDQYGNPVLAANGTFASVDDDNPARSFARIILWAARNDDDTPLFAPDQLDALAGKAWPVLQRLGQKALALANQDAAGLAAIAGNSAAQSDG